MTERAKDESPTTPEEETQALTEGERREVDAAEEAGTTVDEVDAGDKES